MQDPNVVVIVPTYNRKKQLKKCLNQLEHLTYPDEKLDIVVVDDGSTDGTRDILEKRSSDRSNVSAVYHETNQGVAAARNSGLEEAEGDLIFFTDDDCLVPRDWIQQHLQRYTDNPDVIGVDGVQWPIEMNAVEAFKLARYWHLHQKAVVIDRRSGESASTNNLSYRWEVFEEVDWFDPSFRRGSDTEHGTRVLKAGFKILKDPELKVRHMRKDSFTEFLRTKYRLGVSVEKQEQKHQHPGVERRSIEGIHILQAWKHYHNYVGPFKSWTFPVLGGMSIAARKLGEVRGGG